jgi:hypothetical protein
VGGRLQPGRRSGRRAPCASLPFPARASPLANHDRLAYELLADSLNDRNLVDGEALAHILGQCQRTGGLFPAILVREGLVSDWELSRVSCDIFGLPFLPLEVATPSPELEGVLEPAFIRQHGVVPLDRFGDMMTIAMPGMVEGAVLREIEKLLDVSVKPIVSSVESNMRWIENNISKPELVMPAGHIQLADHRPIGDPANDGEAHANAGGSVVLEMGEPTPDTPRPVLEVREEELENSLQMFDLVEQEENFEPSSTSAELDDALLESEDFLGLGDLDKFGEEEDAA